MDRRGLDSAPGIEDTFKSYRRLVKKGTENQVVSILRLYQNGVLAARNAFCGVHQDCWVFVLDAVRACLADGLQLCDGYRRSKLTESEGVVVLFRKFGVASKTI